MIRILRNKYNLLNIMENKIQELTDKIYREGVEKGNAQAQALIAKAQEEAKEIVAKAQAQADSIIADAKKSADDLSENSKSELKRFGAQAVNALKNEVINMLSSDIVKSDVSALASSKDFMNDFILNLAKNWSASEGITIQTADADSLKSYFAAKAKDLLDKNVNIELANGLKTKFSIAPADGSYRVNFGEEEFENYLKDFLRPQLVELLFK